MTSRQRMPLLLLAATCLLDCGLSHTTLEEVFSSLHTLARPLLAEQGGARRPSSPGGISK